MSEPVKIVIILEGGLVQQVMTGGVPVDYAVIDYDTDGADEADTIKIPQTNGSTEDAFGHLCGADHKSGDRAMKLFETVEKLA